jgi:hypothetical protein
MNLFFCTDFKEDETRVLLNCPFYDDFRENLFYGVKRFRVMSFEKIMFLFSNEIMMICARTYFLILKRRRNS